MSGSEYDPTCTSSAAAAREEAGSDTSSTRMSLLRVNALYSLSSFDRFCITTDGEDDDCDNDDVTTELSFVAASAFLPLVIDDNDDRNIDFSNIFVVFKIFVLNLLGDDAGLCVSDGCLL